MQTKLTLAKLHNFLGDGFKSDSNAQLHRKAYNGDIAIDPNEERTIIAKISTIDIDRDGEVILPQGIDTSKFMENPVVLHDHRHSETPVGKIVKLEATDNALYAKIKFATTEKANEIWQLVKGGFLKACSIGFIPSECIAKGTRKFKEICDQLKLDATKVINIVTNCELIENSMVSIPCNSSALVQAVSTKSLSLSDEMLSNLGIKELVEKPYKEEHSFPQNSPDKYESLRRSNDEFGEGIDVIWGVLSDGTTEVQSIRVDATQYTYDEAKAKIEEMGYSVANGEPAGDTNEVEEDNKDIETLETKEVEEGDNDSVEQGVVNESNNNNSKIETTDTISLNGVRYRLVKIEEEQEASVGEENTEAKESDDKIAVEDGQISVETESTGEETGGTPKEGISEEETNTEDDNGKFTIVSKPTEPTESTESTFRVIRRGKKLPTNRHYNLAKQYKSGRIV